MTDYLQYNLYGVLSIFAGVFSLTLGGFVFFKKPKSNINRAYLLIMISTFIWVFCFGMIALVRDESHAPFWLRLSYVGGVPFISPNFYLFTHLWVNNGELKYNPCFSYLLAFLAMIPITFFDSHIITYQMLSWGRYNLLIPTFWNYVYFVFLLLFFFTYAIGTVRNLYKGWKSAPNSEKAQFRYFLIAFLIAYTGSVDWFIIVRLNTISIGFVSLIIYSTIMAYIIIRHGFLDFQLVFKKITTVMGIYIVILLVILPIAYPILRHLLFNQNDQTLLTILVFCFTVGLLFSSGPFIYAYLIRHSYWLRGHMSTGFTHELKSPLSAIQSAADILQLNLENKKLDKNKFSEYVSMIQKNTSRLDMFVKNLLNLSKIQEGNVVMEKEWITLDKLLSPVLETYVPLTKTKGLHLETTYDNEWKINVDPIKFQQIISNLLSNAIKYSKSGKIDLTLSKEKNNLKGMVKDQGTGVTKTDLKNIFNRFYQTKNTHKGSGIGLTIAKAWVETHGGKIWAESAGEGKGTMISFTLPVG